MKTILCDIGGVLLEVDFARAINRLTEETGFSGEEINDSIFLSGIKDRHDSGNLGTYEFYKQIISDGKITFERFKFLWSDIFTEKYEMVDYISSCSKSCRLFIASNTDPIHYNFFHKNYPWFSLFDGFGLSFNLKSIKPSTEFYMKLCKEFTIDYREALFVDDLPENIETANSLGIKSHLFVDVEGFEKFMKDTDE